MRIFHAAAALFYGTKREHIAHTSNGRVARTFDFFADRHLSATKWDEGHAITIPLRPDAACRADGEL